MKKDNIILIGMPGCGKTTIAAELVKKTGLNSVDSDNLIEKDIGIKISEIFEKFGESFFREKETLVLKSLLKEESFILSTGGGIVERVENIEILKELGLIFYLKIEPPLIYDRIKNDKSRPLLLKDNPLEALNQIYLRRKDKYKLADYIINADNEVNKITDEIIEIYEKINS